MEMLPSISKFSKCNIQDAETYENDHWYKLINDEEILYYVTESWDLKNEDENDENEGGNIPDTGPSHEKAITV